MTLVQWGLAILYGVGIVASCAYALRRLYGEDRASEAGRLAVRGQGIPPTVWLFALAVAARLVFVALTGKLSGPDTYEQEEMALAALAGRGFSYDLLGTEYQAYGPPLFTLFGTLVYGLVGHRPAVLVVADALVAAASVPMAYGIARRLFGSRGALVAALLAALHPALLVYAGKLHELNVEVPLAAGIVLGAIWWSERHRWEDALAFAAFTAIGAMGRPTFLFVAVPIAAWSLWRSDRRRSDALRIAAGALLAVAILAPWTLYVSGIYGRPIFFNVSGGIVFWYGNNPAATGSGVDPSGRAVFDDVPPALLARISRTDALSADAALREAAWSYIQEDPAGAVARTAQKLLWFWTISPNAGALYPAAWRGAYLAYYALVAALALVGLVAWRARRAAGAMVAIASLFVIVSVLQSAFYVDGRHRWALESVLLCLSGGGLSALLDRYRSSLSAMSSRWRPSG